MSTILAIAAEQREFEGVLRRVSSYSKLRSRVKFLTEASWNGDQWLLAANGPGPRLAREAVLAALEHTAPDTILSTGYCGALAASLSVADIFCANRVVAGDEGREFEARTLEACAGRADGALLSVDRVAATAEEKTAMHRRGYAAVEMEAAGVAACAMERALPFYCVRVVSDAANESMPLDLNAYRDDDGRFRKPAIAAAALRRFSIAKDLVRLNRQCRSASEALGGFLANCRF